MKTAIFKKNLFNKKDVRQFLAFQRYGTNKSIANFRETIPLIDNQPNMIRQRT
jgi:hypothetical protein